MVLSDQNDMLNITTIFNPVVNIIPSSHHHCLPPSSPFSSLKDKKSVRKVKGAMLVTYQALLLLMVVVIQSSLAFLTPFQCRHTSHTSPRGK